MTRASHASEVGLGNERAPFGVMSLKRHIHQIEQTTDAVVGHNLCR